ncbi:MAG: helicase-associated domain-containing protein [Anaerolineae bacterium]|nr:helicase-associated domain-containing protein [Anaerolineae bacterium]
MSAADRRFDSDLYRMTADKLKPMMKLWGGKSNARKDECLALITQSLKDPEKVKAAVAGLNDIERNALALMKRMNGIVEYNALGIGLLAAGIYTPHSYPRYHSPYSELVNKLFRRGLIMGTGHSPSSFQSSYESHAVYTDHRLLAYVGNLEIVPFRVEAMPTPPHSAYRCPPNVVLDIVGMLQAVDTLGGIKLTKDGNVRIADAARWRKLLHWEEECFTLDGFVFPDPVTAWIDALRYSDLLAVDNGTIFVKETPDAFAARPYAEQARLFVEGFIRSGRWWELANPPYFDMAGKGRRQGRLAITLALAALPLDSDAFFSLDDFDLALYFRIGEYFALDYPPRAPFMYRETEDEAAQKIAKWRDETRADWLKQERPWIERALTTWLYFLGLIEIGLDHGSVVGLRLTQLGREVFHPELASASVSTLTEPASDQPVWVVQPNFDIVAYLDRAGPTQLAFLERHAERAQAHVHTAHYRLTRESIYRGLESGVSLEELLQVLEAGANALLPQNVAVEIREWAELRERLIVRQRAHLLEFPNADDMQAALDRGLVGDVVGERCLLVDESSKDAVANLKRFDYAAPLPKCLTVSEEGLIGIKAGPRDLAIDAQLAQWAERLQNGDWQITETSVQAALKRGLRLKQLLAWLDMRLSHRLWPFLALALRSWAGTAPHVELETVIVLRCPDEQVFLAIASSERAQSFLTGCLEPDLLFVNPSYLEDLQAYLAWAGFSVSDRLEVTLF